MYELVVIWSNGDKSIYKYETKATAEHAEQNMLMANGNQITWSCVRRVFH